MAARETDHALEAHRVPPWSWVHHGAAPTAHAAVALNLTGALGAAQPAQFLTLQLPLTLGHRALISSHRATDSTPAAIIPEADRWPPCGGGPLPVATVPAPSLHESTKERKRETKETWKVRRPSPKPRSYAGSAFSRGPPQAPGSMTMPRASEAPPFIPLSRFRPFVLSRQKEALNYRR